MVNRLLGSRKASLLAVQGTLTTSTCVPKVRILSAMNFGATAHYSQNATQFNNVGDVVLSDNPIRRRMESLPMRHVCGILKNLNNLLNLRDLREIK